ncbi:hypothetical protein [Pseudomonas asiatica]|uniref:hypothetical protein n=1 Tax=Pseudomonas asiatica TaxID=2219225 RepID=UPI0007732E46|nr:MULTISPECIES: hypothetical protein [Pseudomonas]KXK72086.1 hypothetical protein BC89_03590 [Pseudomonas monteilii]PJI70853.1 hypothetical protein CSW00_26900 [Pseudomonas sp. MR 02]
MSGIDWSNAPDGATHFGIENEFYFSAWYKVEGDQILAYSEDGSAWIEATDSCVFPKVSSLSIRPEPWAGEGLPTIGSEVEIQRGGWCIRKESEGFIGAKVVVRAHFRMGSGAEMIAVDGGPDLGCEVFRAEMARPIPTPEQIAAEEKNKAADDLFMTMWPNETLHECEPCNPRWRACFNAISAGYRKQEAS